jgi:hypothetical protein
LTEIKPLVGSTPSYLDTPKLCSTVSVAAFATTGTKHHADTTAKNRNRGFIADLTMPPERPLSLDRPSEQSRSVWDNIYVPASRQRLAFHPISNDGQNSSSAIIRPSGRVWPAGCPQASNCPLVKYQSTQVIKNIDGPHKLFLCIRETGLHAINITVSHSAAAFDEIYPEQASEEANRPYHFHPLVHQMSPILTCSFMAYMCGLNN